jgi:hypothetical protein
LSERNVDEELLSNLLTGVERSVAAPLIQGDDLEMLDGLDFCAETGELNWKDKLSRRQIEKNKIKAGKKKLKREEKQERKARKRERRAIKKERKRERKEMSDRKDRIRVVILLVVVMMVCSRVLVEKRISIRGRLIRRIGRRKRVETKLFGK